MEIREPIVAGQFYPDEPKELKYMINSFLKDDKIPRIEGDIYGLIVPHAGYEFSGRTAAYAFKQLEGKNYDTVIIIAPSHTAVFDGTAVYPEGGFKTPLGIAEIDEELAGEIIAGHSTIVSATAPHIEEHSIEVVVPFLQVLFEKFKIVPVCMGAYKWEDCEILANAIDKSIGKKRVLIVASSDFYHGYDYEECKRSTEKSVALISDYNTEKFYHYFYEHHSACGGAPIVSLMLSQKKAGTREIISLHSTNSADVTGAYGGYVVGYASFVITEGLGKNIRSHLTRNI